MKDLNKILEYQKVDIELKKIYDKFEKNEENKKMELAKNEFNNAKNTVMQCEQQAEVLIGMQADLTTQRDTLLKEYEDLILIVENNEDDESVEANIEKLEEMKKKLSEFEKKVNGIKTKIETVITDYKEANDTGRKQKQAFMQAKNKLDKFKSEYADSINELTGKLDKMSKEIDPQSMAIYKSVTDEGKYPAFVEAYHDSDDMYSCRGCGIALSQKRKSELLEDGACRCETCRRIIYIL